MNKLKEFRKKNKLTQNEVASKLGISQTQYSLHETGKSLLNSKQIMTLSILFNCTPNDLLDFKTFYQSILNEMHDVKK